MSGIRSAARSRWLDPRRGRALLFLSFRAQRSSELFVGTVLISCARVLILPTLVGRARTSDECAAVARGMMASTIRHAAAAVATAPSLNQCR